MRDRFGAPIIVGAATLAALGAYGDGDPAQLAALDACATTPFVVSPRTGVADVGDPQQLDCLRLSIDNLRYTIPGPVRGADPGAPMQI